MKDTKFSQKDMEFSYQEGRKDGLNDMACFIMEFQKSNREMSAQDLVTACFAFKQAMEVATKDS